MRTKRKKKLQLNNKKKNEGYTREKDYRGSLIAMVLRHLSPSHFGGAGERSNKSFTSAF